jgi:hypothetical protein
VGGMLNAFGLGDRSGSTFRFSKTFSKGYSLACFKCALSCKRLSQPLLFTSLP